MSFAFRPVCLGAGLFGLLTELLIIIHLRFGGCNVPQLLHWLMVSTSALLWLLPRLPNDGSIPGGYRLRCTLLNYLGYIGRTIKPRS
jgi:hypothetical protein